MTGFRVALGGAQSLFKVKPDITTLGKVIGGGLPIGAIGEKRYTKSYHLLVMFIRQALYQETPCL